MDDDDDYEGASHGGAAKPAGALSAAAWSGTNGRPAEREAAGARRGSWSLPPRSLRRRGTVGEGPSGFRRSQRPRSPLFSLPALAPDAGRPSAWTPPWARTFSPRGPGPLSADPPPPSPHASPFSLRGPWFMEHPISSSGARRRHTLAPCTYPGAFFFRKPHASSQPRERPPLRRPLTVTLLGPRCPLPSPGLPLPRPPLLGSGLRRDPGARDTCLFPAFAGRFAGRPA